MTAEVLGGAVNHEVCAVAQRAMVYRRGEGGVDHHLDAARVRDLCDRLHVDHPQEGIGRRLREKERRVVANRTVCEMLLFSFVFSKQDVCVGIKGSAFTHLQVVPPRLRRRVQVDEAKIWRDSRSVLEVCAGKGRREVSIY